MTARRCSTAHHAVQRLARQDEQVVHRLAVKHLRDVRQVAAHGIRRAAVPAVVCMSKTSGLAQHGTYEPCVERLTDALTPHSSLYRYCTGTVNAALAALLSGTRTSGPRISRRSTPVC